MLDLVRALDLSRKRRAGSGGQTPPRSSGEPASPTHDLGALRRRLMALISPINATDEAALRAIRRPLLQEIILWEFGSDFRQHPEFAGMVEEVDQALEVDPQARERLVRLIHQLQK